MSEQIQKMLREIGGGDSDATFTVTLDRGQMWLELALYGEPLCGVNARDLSAGVVALEAKLAQWVREQADYDPADGPTPETDAEEIRRVEGEALDDLSDWHHQEMGA